MVSATRMELDLMLSNSTPQVIWVLPRLEMVSSLTKRLSLLLIILLSFTRTNTLNRRNSRNSLLALLETPLLPISTPQLSDNFFTSQNKLKLGISALVASAITVARRVLNGSMRNSRTSTESSSTQEILMVLYPPTEPSSGSMNSTGTSLKNIDHSLLMDKLEVTLKPEMV